MKNFIKEHIYFSLFVVTILLTRIVLFLLWDTKPMQPQLQDEWHHMYTGLILIGLSIPFDNHYMKIVEAIGLGLFIDEWMHIFHIIFQIQIMDYWSWDYMLVTILGILLIGRYYYKVRLSRI